MRPMTILNPDCRPNSSRSSTVMTPWINRVQSKLARWKKLGTRWVIGVSGGSDSVGLLRVLHEVAPEIGLELSVAHLDHGVRGEAAKRDAQFVSELAERLGLPFDEGHWQPTRQGHFESDARRARYAWLKKVALERGATVVAIGHTRDDQAETILHRIVRGTGPRGLAGMAARRGLGDAITLVRPILEVSREAIRAYLGSLGQTFHDDATNADLSRTRARIRHDLLPKLAADYNPRVSEALVRLGELAAVSHRSLIDWLEEWSSAAIISAGPDAVVLLNAQLIWLPLVLRAEIIRLAWRKAGWPEAGMGAERWLRLAGMIRRENGRFSIGAGIDVWLSTEILRLSPAHVHDTNEPPPSVSFPVPGSVRWDNLRILAVQDPQTSCEETIDFDRLDPVATSDGAIRSLCVRGPRGGDRFEPLGMGGHSMPLNDFLRGRGVPSGDRKAIPVLYDRQGIVWVVGHRIAHRVRLTEATQRTLGLSWVSARD